MYLGRDGCAAVHRALQGGDQGFQAYGCHLSTNPFDSIRKSYSLISNTCVFVSLNAGALTV